MEEVCDGNVRAMQIEGKKTAWFEVKLVCIRDERNLLFLTLTLFLLGQILRNT